MHEDRQRSAGLGGLDAEKVRDTLLAAAAAAAAHTLPLFRANAAVANKHDTGFDPVTEADRGAETAIRELIAERFPGHDIIGEEWENTGTGAEHAWIVDPVDGTRAFITGVPVWGTLVGLAHCGRAVAGIMSQPFVGETFLALPGLAEYRRGDTRLPLRAAPTTRLAEAYLFTTSPAMFAPDKRRRYDAVEAAVRQARYGCDCYAYCLLAAGHVDLVIESGLNVYDIAALIPIIREAGGVVAAWDGGPPDGGGDVVAAATPELLAAALEVLAGA